MRVVCIDGKPKESSIILPEGVPLEVSQSLKWDDFYLVHGYEYCPVIKRNVHWHKRRFIPLSDIDEKEMEREWMLTPVELPNQVN